MSELKHSPGPRKPAEWIDENATCDPGVEWHEIKTADGRKVASLDQQASYLQGNKGPCWTVEEVRANARLIAAAPELLTQARALEHLASILNGRQHAGLELTPTMWSELYARCSDMRAAIVKANGT